MQLTHLMFDCLQNVSLRLQLLREVTEGLREFIAVKSSW